MRPAARQGECGGVWGMIDMYLDRYGGSGMEKGKIVQESNLDILGHDSQTFEESEIKSVVVFHHYA